MQQETVTSPRKTLKLTRPRPTPAPVSAAPIPEPKPGKAAPKPPKPATQTAPTPTPTKPQQKPIGPAERRYRHEEKQKAATAVLQGAYPTIFDTAYPVPLAVGIHMQLRAARDAGTFDLSNAQIGLGMVHWTHRDTYLAAVAAGGFRINLDGTPTGGVSAEHAEIARETIRKRRDKVKQPANLEDV